MISYVKKMLQRLWRYLCSVVDTVSIPTHDVDDENKEAVEHALRERTVFETPATSLILSVQEVLRDRNRVRGISTVAVVSLN